MLLKGRVSYRFKSWRRNTTAATNATGHAIASMTDNMKINQSMVTL